MAVPGDLKIAALLETAKAFYNRGGNIQYDQLSMDRFLRITPRRNKFSCPEEATVQHTLFLDCSSFVFSVFFNAFAYKLEADITWEMADYVNPKVYSYTPTHNESAAECVRISRDVMTLLRPGDTMVIEHCTNGHVMLYAGEGQFYHCMQKNGNKSYDYENKRDTFSSHGAIYLDSVNELFFCGETGKPGRYYIFLEKVKRFCILRPMCMVGVPTADAIARIDAANGLVCSVLCSHPGGKTADAGDLVHYTVCVRNTALKPADVHVEAAASDDYTPISAQCANFSLQPEQETEAVFTMRAINNGKAWFGPSTFSVNGLKVWAERVLCGNNEKKQSEKAKIERIVVLMVDEGKTAVEAVAEVYGKCGGFWYRDAGELLRERFLCFDSVAENTLWRLRQNPRRDMCLYSYFGGTGVITPEVAYCREKRVTKVLKGDLQAGDLILCSDDAHFIEPYACIYTGKTLVGSFRAREQCSEITGAALESYLDSLLGRYCFILLRPSLWEGDE